VKRLTAVIVCWLGQERHLPNVLPPGSSVTVPQKQQRQGLLRGSLTPPLGPLPLCLLVLEHSKGQERRQKLEWTFLSSAQTVHLGDSGACQMNVVPFFSLVQLFTLARH
jgi:hypothetical protein